MVPFAVASKVGSSCSLTWWKGQRLENLIPHAALGGPWCCGPHLLILFTIGNKVSTSEFSWTHSDHNSLFYFFLMRGAYISNFQILINLVINFLNEYLLKYSYAAVILKLPRPFLLLRNLLG